jgi:ubiquitin carboxyl-terminal hydrolase 8
MFGAPEFMKFFINKSYNDKMFLRSKFLLNERKSTKAMKIPGHKYCDAVSALCSNVASGDFTTIKATNLRTMLRAEFTKSQQHDANEFIVSLFGKLQDEQTPKFAKFNSDKYKDGQTAWKGYAEQHNSIIDELFIGMTQTSIRCGKCKNMSYMFECFNHIHLECNHSSLQEAYKEYLSDEILKKDQDYKCEKCNKKVKCRIIKQIVKMPKYVLFLFKRFDFINGRKISKSISYPERILLDDQFDKNGN